jgi:hypothetical protein
MCVCTVYKVERHRVFTAMAAKKGGLALAAQMARYKSRQDVGIYAESGEREEASIASAN